MATKYMTQREYAEHRNVSAPRITKLKKQGKLAGCFKIISGKQLIDRDKADKALSENLDRKFNPRHKSDQSRAEQIWASIEYARSMKDVHPTMETLRYVVRLSELNPALVTIDQTDEGVKFSFPASLDPGDDHIFQDELNVVFPDIDE